MKTSPLPWLRKAALSGLAASLTLGTLAPEQASARDCSGLTAELSRDPLLGEGFRILKSSNLYRRQDRPSMQIPTGARVLVRAPAGVTEADLHRAATCHASDKSPLAVPGAKLRVLRSGDHYELHITADQRSAALAIQQRVRAL